MLIYKRLAVCLGTAGLSHMIETDAEEKHGPSSVRFPEGKTEDGATQ